MAYSAYYQARVFRARCWFLVAILRSFEHLVFDRTFDKENSIFEFFVPEDNEADFLHLMDYFKSEGVVKDLQKLPNRFLSEGESQAS